MNPTTLRDQSTTLDPRMDLIFDKDPSNRNHSVMTAVQAAYNLNLKPISKIWYCPTCLDQKNEGSCAGFMTTHLLLGEPGISDPKIFNAEFAREKLYFPAQMDDEFPGGEYPGADPVAGGTSMKAMMKQAKKMGLITEYKWSFSFLEFLIGVGYYGPAGIGTVWTEDMMRPDSKGVVSATGKAVGGHAYQVYGLNMRTEMGLCLNSWGPDNFGIAGKFQIPFKDLEKLLIKWRGEAVFVKKVKPLPVTF